MARSRSTFLDLPVNLPGFSMGFCSGEHHPSTHVCQIYTSREEKVDLMARFLEAGVQGSARSSCFSDDVHPSDILAHLSESRDSLDEAIQNGSLTFNTTPEVYYPENRFEPEIMLNLLKNYYLDNQKAGYGSSRVIGEMNPKVKELEGGDRIIEYEARVNKLLETTPITCVCQYSASDFSGEEILDILKVHPKMMVKGQLINNPFYIPADEVLSSM